jgi:formylglycine-generating enzyme required for sulfatase activity
MNRPNRIYRGGSFFFESAAMRSASHTTDAPSFQSPYIGFRLARTLKPGR